MKTKIGFDTSKYINAQKQKLQKRIAKFDKLYLEFGGKLLNDQHAVRTLPGYQSDTKAQLLKELGKIDIIYCISAPDIARGKIRGDSGLTYDKQALKEIGQLKKLGLTINSIVITRYKNQPSAIRFKTHLNDLGYNAKIHAEIPGYPDNLEKIIRGYDAQPFIKTKNKLTIVTGAGGGSGKMAVCLSQIYHEYKKGSHAGFAKFETFRIWNLSLNHPVNLAYEAATADLKDTNQIDHLYKKAHKKAAVTYNRDVENFKILSHLSQTITGQSNAFGYQSPTDMGVNMADQGIVDDKICRNAARQEIIRRYFRYKKEHLQGIETKETVKRISKIMKKAKLKETDRKPVVWARKAAKEAPKTGKGHQGIYCGAAIVINNKTIVTGKNSPTLHAESAVILNAIKVLAEIPDEIDLISRVILEKIAANKQNILGKKSPSLDVAETIVALSASAAANPAAEIALSKLKELNGQEMHTTHLPTMGDESGLRDLNLRVTTDAQTAG